MVYELDTLPHKKNTSWWCSARYFSAEILIPSHLATSEQCQLAGTPVWDDAASFCAFLTPPAPYSSDSLTTVLVPQTTRRSSRFRATSFGTFLTNAWPEARAVRSIRGDPGNATNRQAFANPYYLAFPQGLHDPQTKRLGSCVS